MRRSRNSERTLPVPRDKNQSENSIPSALDLMLANIVLLEKIMVNGLYHVLRKIIILVTRSLPAVLSRDHLASPHDFWSAYLHE